MDKAKIAVFVFCVLASLVCALLFAEAWNTIATGTESGEEKDAAVTILLLSTATFILTVFVGAVTLCRSTAEEVASEAQVTRVRKNLETEIQRLTSK
jgi:hypothetical protein